MAGMIRRVVLGAGLLAGTAAVVGWRMRGTGLRDLAYGPGARQRLDIWLPEGEGPFPVVVEILGRDFRSGDKAEVPVAPEVLAAGIAVVRVTYRLSGTDLWPAQAEDCLAAVAFLQRTGQEYGLDASRLALSGHSAGAFLAVSAAVSLVEVGLPPKGVVSLYGPMDFSTMDADMAALGRTSPLGRTDAADSAQSGLLGYPVGAQRATARAMGPVGRLASMQEPLPPIFIRHGDADPVVADLQAKRLREAWLAADPSAEVDYALVPGAGHGGAGFDTDVVIGPMVAFLTRVLG